MARVYLDFFYARHAIYYLLEYLQIKEGDEILTPAWDCDDVLHPFRAKKCKLVFYKTDPYTLKIDLDHLTSQISPRTKLIHIINHFGLVQDWNSIKELKKTFSNIQILEDNAYSLGSRIEDEKIGTLGDYSIFSFKKVYPVINGARICFNNKCCLKEKSKRVLFYPNEIKRIPFFFIDLFSFKVGNIARNRFFYKDSGLKKDYKFPLYSDPEKSLINVSRGKIDDEFLENPMKQESLLTMIFLKLYSLLYKKKIGRKNFISYCELSSYLKDKSGIRIIQPNIDDHIIPTAFSFLVENNRDYIFYELRKDGYPVFVWPTLPLETVSRLNEFPEMEILGRKLLQVRLYNFKPMDWRRFSESLDRLLKQKLE